MKQRYVSLILSVVVLFLSAGILSVLAQQETYSAPTEAFPGGLKDAPVNTGGAPQTKSESFAPTQMNFTLNSASKPTGIVLNTGQMISSGVNYFTLSAGSGWALINAQGLVIPKLSASPTAAEGMIYYDTTGKKVKLYNGTAWADIGTGSGTGDNFWKTDGSGGIYYDGTVTLGNTNVGTGAFFATGVYVMKNNNNQFSIVNKAYAEAIQPNNNLRLACDVSDTAYDCISPYTPSSGVYSEGDVRYDKVGTCPDGYSIVGNQCGMYIITGSNEFNGTWSYAPITYQYREFKFKKLATTGTLYAGKTYVDDVYVVSKTWHNETPYAYATDNAGGTKRGTATCPAGYYVVGVEAWDNDGGGYCVGCLTGMKLKCAKL